MIITRTPLRVSFFGGGTDFQDYYRRDYGCVLSTSIDKYIYVMVNRRFDDKIQLNYRMTEIVDSVDQIFHPTIREAMRFAGVEDSTEMSNMADVHAHGTGLGSSSSFLVGMLNALHAYNGERADAEKLARDACHIEIEVLKEPIGKQDQYIAAYGGLKFIRFNKDESVSVEEVKVPEGVEKALASKLMFFYTGISRRSGQVLKGQKANIEQKLEVLDKMRGIAERMRDELRQGRIEEFGVMLDESWQAKRSLAGGISNEAIDAHYQKAREAGAQGGKVLGAGGGGFLMFYCDEEKQEAVRKALGALREVRFGFSPTGSEIIFDDHKEKSW
ncbi:MAG: GHMP kinase [Candidatus Micrarchaeota archaeon]|nr:GHMP kinase [Candidatus Micrarchaeota archaeon]